MSTSSREKMTTALKIEKLNRKDFELNKCFCRPRKRFKQRKLFPKVETQILGGLVPPEILLKRQPCLITEKISS